MMWGRAFGLWIGRPFHFRETKETGVIQRPKTAAEVAERYDNVLRVLRAIQADEHARTKHFNMGTWGMETTCGTVACAAGHCSFDPYFIALGFEGEFESRISPEFSRLLQIKGYNEFHAAVSAFFRCDVFEVLEHELYGGFYLRPSAPVEEVIEYFEKKLAKYRIAHQLPSPEPSESNSGIL